MTERPQRKQKVVEIKKQSKFCIDLYNKNMFLFGIILQFGITISLRDI